MRDKLSLTSLIVSRCRELGCRKVDLVVRAGYKNRARGLRRLDALLDGDLDAPQELMSSLPAAVLRTTICTGVRGKRGDHVHRGTDRWCSVT
jgi:hypothetical protein